VATPNSLCDEIPNRVEEALNREVAKPIFDPKGNTIRIKDALKKELDI
jgi:hypothetical protein